MASDPEKLPLEESLEPSHSSNEPPLPLKTSPVSLNASIKSPDSSAEFQCRPIRLGHRRQASAQLGQPESSRTPQHRRHNSLIHTTSSLSGSGSPGDSGGASIGEPSINTNTTNKRSSVSSGASYGSAIVSIITSPPSGTDNEDHVRDNSDSVDPSSNYSTDNTTYPGLAALKESLSGSNPQDQDLVTSLREFKSGPRTPSRLAGHSVAAGLGLRVVSTPDHISSNVRDPIFALCLVNFHHIRGPEVEYWKSNYIKNYHSNLFRNMAFQALPDGLHLFEETFSNFALVYDFEENESLDDGNDYNRYLSQVRNLRALKTLFGCLCIRQISLERLSAHDRAEGNVTRLIVQKAVVVVLREPLFAYIKEKLSIVTGSYFEQADFGNYDILDSLHELLNHTYGEKSGQSNRNSTVSNDSSYAAAATGSPKRGPEMELRALDNEASFVLLDLRNLLIEFGSKIFTLYKALLLEKKVLVYSNSNLEGLTNFQNSLISLIPGLMSNLELLGCPLLDYTEQYGPLQRPSLLDTKSKKLLLRFFGLPLQVLNTKGSFYNPYLPLQQLSELLLDTTKSCLAGCLNRLFVDQAASLKIDVLVDLDLKTVSYPQGKPEDLTLSSLDKRFVSNLVTAVKNADGSYQGSDDHIRYSFEDYLFGLVLTYRFNQYTVKFKIPPPGFNTGMPLPISNDDVETDLVHNGNLALFGRRFIESWSQTANYKIWNATADEFVFNFLDPKHVAANLESLIELFFLAIRNFGAQGLPLGSSEVPSKTKPLEQPMGPEDLSEVHVVYNPANTEVKLQEDTPLTRLSAWWNKKK